MFYVVFFSNQRLTPVSKLTSVVAHNGKIASSCWSFAPLLEHFSVFAGFVAVVSKTLE